MDIVCRLDQQSLSPEDQLESWIWMLCLYTKGMGLQGLGMADHDCDRHWVSRMWRRPSWNPPSWCDFGTPPPVKLLLQPCRRPLSRTAWKSVQGTKIGTMHPRQGRLEYATFALLAHGNNIKIPVKRYTQGGLNGSSCCGVRVYLLGRMGITWSEMCAQSK